MREVGHDAQVKVSTSSQLSAPWGVFGGHNGVRAHIEMGPGAGSLEKGASIVPNGATVTIGTAGAGGYGRPERRARELVMADLEDERISARTATEVYGVVQ